MLKFLHERSIGCQLQDERCNGEPLELAFNGQLHADQEMAAERSSQADGLISP